MLRFAWGALAPLLSLGLAAAATAGDVPVRYDADLKLFKKGIDADSTLRFELFDDANCNNEIDQFDFAATAVTVEEVKPLKLKGGERQARRARISAVFPDAVEADSYFLIVSDPAGDAVEPAGDECQAQSSGTAGTFSAGLCTRRVGTAIVFTPLTIEEQTSIAACNAGEVVVGGGQVANQAAQDQICVVLENGPSADLTSWVLRMTSVTQGLCGGSFSASAICCGT